MQLHDLKPAADSRKRRKRVGRGPASGLGKTSGRGHKGAGSRSGGGKGPGFEGGQTPLAMRLPKLPGFVSHNKTYYAVINVERVDELGEDGDIVDGDSLHAKGVIKKPTLPVKVLGEGEITKKLTVKVDKISGSAQEKIEGAGGTVEPIC